VEKYLDSNFYKNGDNFPHIQQVKTEQPKEIKTQTDNLDLVAAIQKELKSKHSVAPVSKAYIKSISLSLIDNKVQVGH